MLYKIKKITGEEFVANIDKDIAAIYEEIIDANGSNFILLGDRIEQKMTIESIVNEG